MTNAPYIVETFTASELVVDITEHELVCSGLDVSFIGS